MVKMKRLWHLKTLNPRIPKRLCMLELEPNLELNSGGNVTVVEKPVTERWTVLTSLHRMENKVAGKESVSTEPVTTVASMVIDVMTALSWKRMQVRDQPTGDHKIQQ